MMFVRGLFANPLPCLSRLAYRSRRSQHYGGSSSNMTKFAISDSEDVTYADLVVGKIAIRISGEHDAVEGMEGKVRDACERLAMQARNAFAALAPQLAFTEPPRSEYDDEPKRVAVITERTARRAGGVAADQRVADARVTCSICGARTRNLDKHNAASHG